MKYCKKCGKELRDEAVICVGCGCSVSETSSSNRHSAAASENPTLAIMSLIFAFIMPPIGCILGIIGMNQYSDPTLRNRSKSGMCFSLSALIIYCFIACVIAQI